jgi:hypothetical protein
MMVIIIIIIIFYHNNKSSTEDYDFTDLLPASVCARACRCRVGGEAVRLRNTPISIASA